MYYNDEYYDNGDPEFDSILGQGNPLFPEANTEVIPDQVADQVAPMAAHDSTDQITNTSDEPAEEVERLDETDLAHLKETIGAMTKVEPETGRGRE